MKRKISPMEWLGAVVSVGLVGAFVLPLLASGRSNANRATCLGNLKQIGASLMMYADDWDAVLPRTSEERPKKGLGAHWTYVVQRYARSKSIFVCPADQNPGFNTKGSVDTPRRVPLLSYVNNYAAIPAHDFYPVPISALTDPANMIVLGERRHQINDELLSRSWKGTSGFFPGQPCRELELGVRYRRTTAAEAEKIAAIARNDKDLLIIRLDWTAHHGGSNYTFADGHAEFETLSRTLDPNRFQWGERFYPRSMPDADCDGLVNRRRRSQS